MASGWMNELSGHIGIRYTLGKSNFCKRIFCKAFLLNFASLFCLFLKEICVSNISAIVKDLLWSVTEVCVKTPPGTSEAGEHLEIFNLYAKPCSTRFEDLI